MKEYTIQVGEVFTEEKAQELKEYLELKDGEIQQEKERILKRGYELIEWNKDPLNNWAGDLHKNATINAIQQILDIVQSPLNGTNDKE